ncbi:MAG: hypothetical protein DRP03_00765 [Candidatus Aenigmatarchaeota archaeon]|nr:MAG: hypothetical protein DRP03_00765 [Candidatus Aenigmarchaeota archaeon]
MTTKFVHRYRRAFSFGQLRLEGSEQDVFKKLEKLKSICAINSTRLLTQDLAGNKSKVEMLVVVPLETCDTELIKDIEDIPSPYIPLAAKLPTSLALKDITDSFSAFINERYPKEGFLLVEKLYDIIGLYYVIRYKGMASEVIGRLFSSKCKEFSKNESKYEECAVDFLKIEKRLALILESRINLREFDKKCESAINEKNIPSCIDTAGMCHRIGTILNEMCHKLLIKSEQETNHERCFKVMFCYTFSNFYNDPEGVAKHVESLV